jgi:alpha-L-rhamnosidase
VLYDMLERTDSPSYGYQLSKGATALTEAWDADPNSSQDHFMLGHAEEWFYRGLGGIQIDFSADPQRQLFIRPEIVGKLSSVRTSYESVWGPIESNWKRGPAETEYDIVIPPNATATVELKTARPQSVQVNGVVVQMNGAKAAHASGVIKAVADEHIIDLVLGSGRYRILARNHPAQP